MIYITGPGHGGPGLVANTYLEGTYSEVYPNISQNEQGMKRLFKQFSFPGGVPSHVAPETPGSIHEGGELGYALSHAYGAAFDNPDLIVACVVGDGEAETGPMATSWHSNKFLNPVARWRGSAGPPSQWIQDRQSHAFWRASAPRSWNTCFAAMVTRPIFVEGHDPDRMHQLMAAALDKVIGEIQRIKTRRAPERFHRTSALANDHTAHAERMDLPQRNRRQARPRATGARIRCRWARCTTIRRMCRILEDWMKSYRPAGAVRRERPAPSRTGRARARGDRRMSANPHANGGLLLRDLRLPDFRDYAVEVTQPGRRDG